MNANETARVIDTILSIPGMNEMVKIDVKISRQNVLLLSNIIERGLASIEADKTGLLSVVSKETMEELKQLQEDYLNKAGLKELNEKLKSFH